MSSLKTFINKAKGCSKCKALTTALTLQNPFFYFLDLPIFTYLFSFVHFILGGRTFLYLDGLQI